MNVNLTTVYMKNLRNDITEIDLKAAIEEHCGPILYCKSGSDSFFNKGKYAIIDFLKFESA